MRHKHQHTALFQILSETIKLESADVTKCNTHQIQYTQYHHEICSISDKFFIIVRLTPVLINEVKQPIVTWPGFYTTVLFHFYIFSLHNFTAKLNVDIYIVILIMLIWHSNFEVLLKVVKKVYNLQGSILVGTYLPIIKCFGDLSNSISWICPRYVAYVYFVPKIFYLI